jgi:DNA-binding GntR family transcriptional regulator
MHTQVGRTGSLRDEGAAVTNAAAPSIDPIGVYNALKAMAIDYRFRPGRQILVSDIADNLRVSPGLVTEALTRLHSEAWLDPASRRGFFPKTLNLAEMIDLYQYGFLLLRHAAIQNIDAADVNSLESGSQRRPTELGLKTALSPEEIRRCSRYLEWSYGAIVSLSRNQFMIATMAEIIDRTHYVRLIDIAAPDRFNEVLNVVDAILAALADKDAERIVAILERELDRSIAIVPALIRTGMARAHSLGFG